MKGRRLLAAGEGGFWGVLGSLAQCWSSVSPSVRSRGVSSLMGGNLCWGLFLASGHLPACQQAWLQEGPGFGWVFLSEDLGWFASMKGKTGKKLLLLQAPEPLKAVLEPSDSLVGP